MAIEHLGEPVELETEDFLEDDVIDEPIVAVVGPTTVELPGGYGLSDGTVARTATVRELTGYDEEELARADVKRPLDFIAKLVMLGVKSIGSTQMTPMVLDGLLLGDRDTLILGIRRATYGDTLQYTELRCPNCQRDFDVEMNMDEIPIKKLDDPADRQFTVKLLRGAEATLVLPTHGDQAAMIEESNKIPDQNTVLLARCLRRLGDRDVTFDQDTPEEIVKSLNMRDRQLLIEELRKRQPGPQFEEVKINCPACDFEDRLVIDPISLFRL